MRVTLPVRWMAGLVLVAMLPAIRPAAPARLEVASTLALDTMLPLRQSRTIRFTTDEGTWMSVDVSPSGTTVVFDLLGDLYTIPITGGKATRLTSGPAFDAQPRYSTDGRQIVFTSDRNGADNVWVMDADGRRPRQITAARRTIFTSPEWLPDGHGIVVSQLDLMGTYGVDLVLYREGAPGGVKLIDHSDSGAPALTYGATPAADARYLYIATTLGVQTQATWRISRLDRVTGKLRSETPADRHAFRPALSRDGRFLAYLTRVDTSTVLVLRDLASGDDRTIAETKEANLAWTEMDSRDVFPGYAFTPDNQAIIMTSGGRLWRFDLTSKARTPIPFTVDVDLRLGPLSAFSYTESDSIFDARQIRWPRLSPDGKRVAFSALDHVWTMDLPAGAPRRITADSVIEDQPVWSPDGRYIAYVTWSDEDGGDIWRVRADRGGAPENLSRHPALYEKVSYTPDGTKLVAVRGPRAWQSDRRSGRGEQNGLDLVWLPAAGGDARIVWPLSTAPHPYSFLNIYGWPHFTSDTSRIFLEDPVDGLVSLRFDGSDRQRLFKAIAWQHPIGDLPAHEVLLSPDATRALAFSSKGVYLLSLTPGGPYPDKVVLTASEAAPIPVREIPSPGADFIGWRADGKAFYYSLGHTLFLYDCERADSAAAARREYQPTRIDIRIPVRRDRPEGTIALRGARIITMRGDEVIADGDIVIEGNRIKAVGRHGSVPIPSGARVVELRGETILPGYVDVHAHMRLAWGIHDGQPWSFLGHLAYGVTTTRDPQSHSHDVFTYVDRVAAGDLVGPRFLTTGPGVFPWYEIASLRDAERVARRYGEYYRSNTLKQYGAGNRQVRQWLVMAAHKWRLTPTNDGEKDLTYVLDGYAGFEHLIATYPVYRDVIELIAQSGTTYTPTLSATESYFTSRYRIHDEPKARRFFPHTVLDELSLRQWSPWLRDELYAFPTIAAGTGKIVAAGGRVGMGAHGDIPGLGSHLELWAIASGGLPALSVLRVGTLFGAEAVGLGRELGSLEVGKLADLQVLDKNPLENIRNTNTVRYVMKNGRLYDANTLDELWSTQRKLGRLWWRDRDVAP